MLAMNGNLWMNINMTRFYPGDDEFCFVKFFSLPETFGCWSGEQEAQSLGFRPLKAQLFSGSVQDWVKLMDKVIA